jgi:CheY-like chemotaxis protein
MAISRVLLVEDDENDARITERALRKVGFVGELVVARDGERALDWLTRRLENTEALPELVLMDLSLPRLTGLEVLTRIKRHPDLRTLTVLMVTTSSRPEDITAAFANGANGFVCKPVYFARFVEALSEVLAYWAHATCGRVTST